MALLDTLKGLFGRARTLAEEHPDQVKAAMAKAEGVLDDKTGHKYSSQLQAGADKATEYLDGQSAPAQPAQPPADQPPAAQ